MTDKRRFFIFCLLVATWVAVMAGFCVKQARAVTWTQPTPPVVQQVVSAGGGAQSNAATITSSTGRMAYIEGFDVTGGGATAAALVEITTTGLSNNLKFEVPVAAGVTAPMIANVPVYSVRFPTPIPASAANTNIVVTLPSFGAGNTNAAITVYGFTQ
jgi:hypothetical protein